MAVEVEDDVFFADLSKQIAMLIMDDEEEFQVQPAPLPVQELPYMPEIMMLQPYINAIPSRRESKGTGVFIPKSTAPRKKNSRSKRSTPMGKNSPQRQLQKSAVVASTITDNSDIIYPNHCSNSSSL